MIDKRSLNIKVIIPAFYPDFAGWIQQLINLVRYCNMEKFKFSIFTRKPRNKYNKVFNNIAITRVYPSTRYTSNVANLIFVIKGLLHLTKSRSKIDLLYIPFLFFPGFVFIPIAKFLRIPVMGQISGEEIREKNRWISRIRTKMICRMDLIIVLNRYDEKRLIELNIAADKIRLLPNHIDIERFHPVTPNTKDRLKKRWNIREDVPVLSFAGLINYRKGVHILLDAVNRLFLKGYTFELLLAGPYTDAAELDPDYVKKVIRERQHPNIHFLGNVDNIDEIYQLSDLFILPSFAEGMPGVIIEALASGLICICSDIPGNNEVISDGWNGFLFSPGDRDDLYSKLIFILDHLEEQNVISDNARQSVTKKYASKVIVKEYERIFSELIV